MSGKAIRETCAVCGLALPARACSGCGQPIGGRLTFVGIVSSFSSRVAELDFALLRTFRALCTSPGTVCRDYIEGRRGLYTSPLKYLFIASTLAALVIAFQVAGSNAAGVEGVTWAVGLLPYQLFVVLLPVALLHQRLFADAGLTTAECYAAELFIAAQAIFVFTVVLSTGLLEEAAALSILLAAGVAYAAWGLRTLHRVPWPEAVLKSVLLSLAAVSIWAPIITLLFTYGLSRELSGMG